MAFDPIALAMESPDRAAFEAAVLAGLEREVGFDVGFFAAKGARPTTVGVDADAIERATALGTHDEELRPLKELALRRRGVVVDTDVLPWSAIVQTRYHQDFAARLNGRHTLIALPSLRGSPACGLVLGRAGGAFSARDLGWLEDALPALAVAHASFPAPPPRLAAPTPASRLPWPLGSRQAVLERRTLGCGEVVVRDRDGHREMVLLYGRGEVVWTRTALSDPCVSGWPYVDLMLLGASVAQVRARALVIGCGGGVLLHALARVHPGIALDVVESEPGVIELARAWFALGTIPRLAVHVADGRRFLAHAPPATWDVVLMDAFSDHALARELASPACFAAIARVLRPGGAMAFNVIGTLRGPGAVRRVVEGARAAFGDVRVVPVVSPRETFSSEAARNVVVIGRQSP